VNSYLLGSYQGDRLLSIDNYFRYCQQDLPPYLPDWNFVCLRPGSSHNDYRPGMANPRVRGWNDHFLEWPLQLSQMRADIFHIVDQGLAWYRLFLQKGKVIVTVHDLINLLVMRGRLSLNSIPARRQVIVKIAIEQIKKADAVVCVSRNTADCVLAELGIPAKRLYVIHNIVPVVFRPVSKEERCETRKRLFPGGGPVILHVGKPSAYKNRTGVLKIFDIVQRQIPQSRLILTSESLTAHEKSFLSNRKCAPAIQVFTPDKQEELRLLYGASDVLVFPSLYEGFGWPSLEAMACGCPVVSSTGGSLGEVVGEAGITISDPRASQSFADAIISVVQDQQLSAQLREAGLTRARKFSSSILTPQLADVYRGVAA
jgi:glycosyltransferase involved in cell wall biosynthesis